MIGNLNIGGFIASVRQQVDAGQRQRKQSGVPLVELVVIERDVDVVADKNRQSASSPHVFFQFLHDAPVEPADIQQVDRAEGREFPAGRGTQKVTRLRHGADSGIHTGAGIEDRVEIIRVIVQYSGGTLHDQHGCRLGYVHNTPPPVVCGQCVVDETGLERVLARLGEIGSDTAGLRLPDGDLVDDLRRQILEFAGRAIDLSRDHQRRIVVNRACPQLNATRGLWAEIGNADICEQRHARGLRVLGWLDRGNRQIWLRFPGTANQMQFRAGLLQFPDRFPVRSEAFPVGGAKIGDHVHDFVFRRVAVEQLLEQTQRGLGTDGVLRHVHRRATLFEFGVESAVDVLGIEIGDAGRQVVVVPLRTLALRKAQQGQLLRVIRGRSALRDARNHLPGDVERADRSAPFGHRHAVVQQDVVVRRPAAEDVEPLVAGDPLGQHRHDQSDHGHPQEQQQQLTHPDPFAMLAIALQKEVHRRPLHAPMPQDVDQMDQHRHGCQQETPG